MTKLAHAKAYIRRFHVMVATNRFDIGIEFMHGTESGAQSGQSDNESFVKLELGWTTSQQQLSKSPTAGEGEEEVVTVSIRVESE
jgi:hypothetical protein